MNPISAEMMSAIGEHLNQYNAFARWVEKSTNKSVEQLSDGDKERLLRQFENSYSRQNFPGGSHKK